MNGRSCAAAAAATTARDPSPPPSPERLRRWLSLPWRAGQALPGGQDDSLDAELARPLNDTTALGRATSGPGIDEQHRLSRAADGIPAVTQLLVLGRCSR